MTFERDPRWHAAGEMEEPEDVRDVDEDEEQFEDVDTEEDDGEEDEEVENLDDER